MFLGVVKKAKKATVAIISFDRSVSSSGYLFVWFLRSLLVFLLHDIVEGGVRTLGVWRVYVCKKKKRRHKQHKWVLCGLLLLL